MNSLEKREGVRGRGENQKELINCWEFKNCGRQPDGEMVNRKGPCPAAIKTIHHRKKRWDKCRALLLESSRNIMWRESRRYICSYDQRLLYMRFLPAREKGVRT